MLIDFHTHTFPDELAGKVIPMIAEKASIRYYTKATNASLLSSMLPSRLSMRLSMKQQSISMKLTTRDCCLLAVYIRIMRTIVRY